MVYIRYERKYRISVNEEELKKEFEEDGADEYEHEVQDKDLAE